MIREADVSILCLPDQAAKEIAAAAPRDAVLIDTSSAHRTAEGWVYGMPELTAGQRDLIRNSTRRLCFESPLRLSVCSACFTRGCSR